MLQKMRKYQFLFEELVKRDFKKKYKRTVLGMFLERPIPFADVVGHEFGFTQFFGRSTPHYTIYLFSGQLVFSYFTDATNSGMSSLMDNSTIFSKINVPKYMFLLSKNVSSFINFCLTLVVFLLFVAIDGIPFRWTFLFAALPNRMPGCVQYRHGTYPICAVYGFQRCQISLYGGYTGHYVFFCNLL